MQLTGTRPATVAPLADVRAAIVQALRQQPAQQTVRSYAESMLKREPIQLNEIELQRSVAKP